MISLVESCRCINYVLAEIRNNCVDTAIAAITIYAQEKYEKIGTGLSINQKPKKTKTTSP